MVRKGHKRRGGDVDRGETEKRGMGRKEDIAVARVKRSSSDCDRAVVTPL